MFEWCSLTYHRIISSLIIWGKWWRVCYTIWQSLARIQLRLPSGIVLLSITHLTDNPCHYLLLHPAPFNITHIYVYRLDNVQHSKESSWLFSWFTWVRLWSPNVSKNTSDNCCSSILSVICHSWCHIKVPHPQWQLIKCTKYTFIVQ